MLSIKPSQATAATQPTTDHVVQHCSGFYCRRTSSQAPYSAESRPLINGKEKMESSLLCVQRARKDDDATSEGRSREENAAGMPFKDIGNDVPEWGGGGVVAAAAAAWAGWCAGVFVHKVRCELRTFSPFQLKLSI